MQIPRPLKGLHIQKLWVGLCGLCFTLDLGVLLTDLEVTELVVCGVDNTFLTPVLHAWSEEPRAAALRMWGEMQGICTFESPSVCFNSKRFQRQTLLVVSNPTF